MRDFKSFFLKRVPQKDRFLKGDKPTQEVFTKLFDSVGFIKEKTDKAKVEEQGFVKLAGATNVKTFTNPDNDFSYAVQPNQLPETKERNLDAPIGDPSMPLSTVEVFKDDLANENRTTFSIRLKQSFLQWLVTRLMPPGGTAAQVLKKGSGSNYATVWEDNDRIAIKTIDQQGIDYAYYTSGISGARNLFSGQGVLSLDININSYLLQGSPDPIPADFNIYGEYTIINMPGVKPGYRLKLRYEGSPANNKPMAFFEAGAFAGNIDLGNFSESIGNRNGVIVYKHETLTFVYGTNNKWILFDHNIPSISHLSNIRSVVKQSGVIDLNNSSPLTDWLTKTFTVRGNRPVKVKIDFSGTIYGLTNSNAQAFLFINDVQVHQFNSNVVVFKHDNVSFSWVGDVNGKAFEPGSHTVRVVADVDDNSARFEFGTLTIS